MLTFFSPGGVNFRKNKMLSFSVYFVLYAISNISRIFCYPILDFFSPKGGGGGGVIF